MCHQDAALAARTIDALAPLTADLIAVPGSEGALTPPSAGTPAGPAAELLSVRHGGLAISRDAVDNTPETLHVRW